MKLCKCNTYFFIILHCILLCHFFAIPASGGTSSGTPSPVADIIDKPFYDAVSNSHHLADRLQEQLGGLLLLPGAMLDTWRQVAAAHSTGFPFLLMVQICIVLLAGILLELFLRKKLRTTYAFAATPPVDGVIYKLMHIGLGILLEGFLLLSFVGITFGLYILIFPEKGIVATIASNYLIGAYYFRTLLFILTIFLSPGRSFLRVLPFTDSVSRSLFVWSSSLCAVEIFLARSGIILKKSGADEAVLLAIVGLIIVSTTGMLLSLIMQKRRRVTDALCPSSAELKPLPLICQFAPYWQLPVLLFLFCTTLFWEIRVLDSGKIHFGKIIIGLLAIPVFLSFDIWGRKLLQIVLTKSSPRGQSQGSLLGIMCSEKYTQRIQSVYRALLLALLIFFFLGLFRIDVALGRMFTAGVLSSILIIILIYLAWQFFTGWVDRRIREEMPDDEDADEGGKGGSRRGTLLLLLRKFVLVLLFVVASISILSALGVNIAPLIAGAGILGLAVSFGAQSLVTDIFSGIFFLIDDAFRVGDYIDTGSAKGLVEHISLRAVRLRHHRGMVQTVPFGKIGTVVNFSRDYIIMKLDFRVKYDTDVDKVRKIVKRIYNELLQDTELGPKLIGKLKSQGVRQMDDSAMIMRIKFTTPPGEQFVMRKEILMRLQEAFGENNIEFAHRNVTVYMPPEDNEKDSTDKKSIQRPSKEMIRGAATAAMLNNEENATPSTENDR